MWPTTGVYALTGTIDRITTEINHTVYVYATGASSGLLYDKTNNILTGSIYSSQFGKINIDNVMVDCNTGDITTASSCSIHKSPTWSGTLISSAIGSLTQTGVSSINMSTKKTTNLYFTNIGFSQDLIDLSGIILLPDPYHITGGYFGTWIYITSWSTTIDIKPDSYIQTWATLILTPMVGEWTAATKSYFAGNTTQFTWVDLSLAGDYAYTIIDRLGNSSTWRIRSIAGTPSIAITAITNVSSTWTVLYRYCQTNSTLTGSYKNLCPEGANPETSSTTIGQVNQIANDSDKVSNSFKIRDPYGNRIDRQSGLLRMEVTRTLGGSGMVISDIPTELWLTPSWISDFSKLHIPQPSWSGTIAAIIQADYTTGSWSDTLLQLRSWTPGKVNISWEVKTFKVIAWPPLSYTPIDSISLPPTPDITFKWLIQNKNSWNSLKISPTGSILRNRESIFSHEYTISDSGSILTPHLEYIITTSSGEIVDRIRSAASDTCNILNNTGTTSTPNNPCEARNRDFSTLSGEISNTLFRTNLPKTNSGTIDIGLTFATGAMTSTGTNTGYLIVMASYEVTWAWIIRYPLIKQTFNTAELTGTIPLKILGQIGSSDLGTSMKSLDLLSSNLINTERDKIRKQAQMMRQNFVSHPLVIDDIAIDIPNQVYIVEWDIYINTDIWPPTPQKPKVLIALKNPSTGAGGNIYIKDTVKDITASLIADGSIFGWDGTAIKPEWVNQLYIRGSIMSNNTIGWAWLSRCPRNTTTCTPTTAINYDFEKIRKLDTGAGWSTTSNAPDASTSFIIEHDPRLVQDSPLVLMRDLTR
jgi:hypothetical protein